MRAEEAYNKSLENKAELREILEDINKSASKGYMTETYEHGFDDHVIKALLDLGYRYFERNSVFGYFSVIITWDPNYSNGMDYEVNYKDLKI